MSKAYHDLCGIRREAGVLESISSLLGWDQETYMPDAGVTLRGEQQALVATLLHHRRTDPRIGELLAQCENDPILAEDEGRAHANLREIRRDYERETRLPERLVSEIAKVTTEAQSAWRSARADSDFRSFEPWLIRIVDLMREKAACLGVPEGGEAYDALLDLYEPDARASDIEKVFGDLRGKLAAFVQEVGENGTPPSTAPIEIHASTAAQHQLGLRVLGAMGMDPKSSRLDITTHPFCSGFGPGDTRLTTRYREDHFTDALYGTMHEGGHGLYEQGLPKGEGLFGQPIAEACSLGIHESQSRMWENLVGRSPAFWVWLRPIANGLFGGALDGFDAESIARACNVTRASHIRVEADEATYNLHIILRFGIERALIAGKLSVRDVPEAWNSAFEEMFAIKVPDDRRGCLQDVHWSAGLMGYFPTYALGNLYAAQLWESAVEAMPGLEEGFERGEFAPLLRWLGERVHEHGRRYSASDLCENATGKPLSAEPLMRHLRRRIGWAYGLGD